ncbi:MAG: 1-acyl-sn-glycerol-3-phosphate acyltransferase [Bacteroidota bacterium]
METTTKDFINVEEILAAKNPQLLKVLPGFLLKYLKRIIHQDFVNDFIRKNGHKNSFEFADAIIHDFGPVVTFKGLENLPESNGAIVASNHPLGGLDAIALIQTVGKKRRDIKFIVNDILLNLKNFENEFIGVNKHGKNAVTTLDNIDKQYNSNQIVLIFPAGLVSRKQQKGIIKDLEWKKSFITKAKKFNRPIIPVHITGTNSAFFYNLSKLRNYFGIKANIEMLYLMDEMYNQRGKSIHITFGKPISPEAFTNEKTDFQWAQQLKEFIYNHQSNLNDAIFKQA